MHLDPSIVFVVGITFALLAGGLVIDYLKQPLIVAYLIAGIVLGPSGIAFIETDSLLSPLGGIGIILLMFFVGMEIQPAKVLSAWKIAVFGTLLQILGSVGVVWLLGLWLDWSIARIVLLGFVISLSSTAVVIKLLQDSRQIDTKIGRETLGILLVQDLAVIAMVIILGLFGGQPVEFGSLALQFVGAALIILLVVFAVRRAPIELPFTRFIQHNHELEVISAFVICFGFALIAGLFQLSTILGAFAAGILISAARETQWFHDALMPFHVLLLAFFFLSIGSTVSVDFIFDNALVIMALVAMVLLTNTFINAAIFKLLGDSWGNSLLAGAMLAQIGEFSFVLAAMGYASGIIDGVGYQFALTTITVSLIVSPMWIAMFKRLTAGIRIPEEVSGHSQAADSPRT